MQSPFRPGAPDEILQVLRQTWPVLVCAALLAMGYVVLVPAGLPYDEPAHWLNVLFYLDHLRMPVLGEPGTSYEAQMGPVAYVLYALIAAPVRTVGGDVAAFYSARAVGVFLHLALVISLATLASRALVAYRGITLIVTIAAGLNPMLIAIATSVQNDTLALLLAAGALLVVGDGEHLSVIRDVVSGALLGLAILTKVVMWPVAVGIGAMLLLRRRPRALLGLAGTAVAVAGWWFLRNLMLYGDLSARAGVAAAGFEFPPLSDATPLSLARSIITYLWLPTEYVRNVVASPLAIDTLVVLLTVAVVIGTVLLLRHRVRPPVLPALLTGIAILAVSTWLFTALTVQALAFRTAYAYLPLVYAAVGALAFVGPRRVAAPLAAALLVINGWFLFEVATLPSDTPGMPFL